MALGGCPIRKREQLAELREAGTLRRIKRFANALIDGVPVRDKDRPGSDVDLLDWLRQCRRAGLYEQGKAIYEKGGLNLGQPDRRATDRGRRRLPHLRPPWQRSKRPSRNARAARSRTMMNDELSRALWMRKLDRDVRAMGHRQTESSEGRKAHHSRRSAANDPGRCTGCRWLGQGERVHGAVLQRQPRPAGDVREPAERPVGQDHPGGPHP